MPASNGGYTSQLGVALYPICIQANNVGAFYFFDITNFNDPNSSSFYDFKVEDVIAGRTPTIRKVIISYKDLGLASFLLNISGTNDAAQVANVSQTVSIGNLVATKVIMTQIMPLEFTAQNLQVSITRLANGGPVSVTKIRLEGTVEITVY